MSVLNTIYNFLIDIWRQEMLDFKELDVSGNDLELLVRELLYNMGLEVYWSGKGPDCGRDLLCIEKYNSHFKEFSRRWLVQCKHNAHSGNAVGNQELGEQGAVINSCDAFNATGYLLVCTTFPSSTVVQTMERINDQKRISAVFWDAKTLERHLLVPENWNLVNRFFPRSSKQLGWQISQIGTNFWYVSFCGYVFYLSLRIGANCDAYLPHIAAIIDVFQRIQLPENHYIRLRAVYFDDKYTQFKLFVDYLIPSDLDINNFNYPSDVVNFCNGTSMDSWIYYEVDIKIYEYYPYSDNFDIDHRSYYAYYISNFRLGMSRADVESDPFHSVFRDDPTELSEQIQNKAFDDLIAEFKKIPFINVFNSFNAAVEHIGYFSDNFSWDTVIEQADYNIDNFFNVQIIFECQDFDTLVDLLSSFPISVEKHFELVQKYVFRPDGGYDKEEDPVYILKIMVHPACAVSKLSFRKLLNEYMVEIKEKVILYLQQT